MMNKINRNAKTTNSKRKVILYGLFGFMFHGSVINITAGPEQVALYDRFQNNLRLFADVITTNALSFDNCRDGSYYSKLFRLIGDGMGSPLSDLTENRGEYKYPEAMWGMDIDALKVLTLGNRILEDDSLALFTVLHTKQFTDDTKVRDTSKIFEFLPLGQRGMPSNQGVDRRLTHDSTQRDKLVAALTVIEKRVKDLEWFDDNAVFVNADGDRDPNALAPNALNNNAVPNANAHNVNNLLAPAPPRLGHGLDRRQPIAPRVDPVIAANIEKHTIKVLKAMQAKQAVPADSFQYLIDYSGTRASILLNRMQALGENTCRSVMRNIGDLVNRLAFIPYDPRAAQVILDDVDQAILEGRVRVADPNGNQYLHIIPAHEFAIMIRNQQYAEQEGPVINAIQGEISQRLQRSLAPITQNALNRLSEQQIYSIMNMRNQGDLVRWNLRDIYVDIKNAITPLVNQAENALRNEPYDRYMNNIPNQDRRELFARALGNARNLSIDIITQQCINDLVNRVRAGERPQRNNNINQQLNIGLVGNNNQVGGVRPGNLNDQIEADARMALQWQQYEWLVNNAGNRAIINIRANQPGQIAPQPIAPAPQAIVPFAPQNDFHLQPAYIQSPPKINYSSAVTSDLINLNTINAGYVNISNNNYSNTSQNSIQSKQWMKDEKNTQKQLDRESIESLVNELELTSFRTIQDIPSASVIVPKHMKDLHNCLMSFGLSEFLSHVDGNDLLNAKLLSTKLLSAAYKSIDAKTAKAFLQEYEGCEDVKIRAGLMAKHYNVMINNVIPVSKMNADYSLSHLKVLYAILGVELHNNIDSIRPEIVRVAIARHNLFDNIADPNIRELFAGDLELLSMNVISTSQREEYEKAKDNEEKRSKRRKDLFIQMNADYIRNGLDLDIFDSKIDVKAVNKFARILGLRAMELNVLLPKVLFSDASYVSSLTKKYSKALDQVTERNDVLQIVRSATAEILDRLYSRKNSYTQEQLLEIFDVMYDLYDMDCPQEIIAGLDSLFVGDTYELSMIKSKDKVAGNELISFARSLISMGKNNSMRAKRFENSENTLIEILAS